MNTRLLLLVLGLGVRPPAAAEQPSLDVILGRLADSQERQEAARSAIVYRQETSMKMLRGAGRPVREERRIYTVAPSPQGFSKKLESFEGRYAEGKKMVSYDSPEFRKGKRLDLDGELMESLYNDLVNDGSSRDGISRDAFPLTRDQQRRYSFTLMGRQKVAGVEAYRIGFEPRKDEDWEDSSPWAGEVLVHPEDFQPIRVTTRFSEKIPGWVKVVFGISIKQLGFNVVYRRLNDGLWFPHTFGTEFHLRIFFGYARDVTFSLENSDFRRAAADSTITYETTQAAIPPE